MFKFFSKLRKHGIRASLQILSYRTFMPLYWRLKYKNAPKYQSPTSDELLKIESNFTSQSINLIDYTVDIVAFNSFKSQQWFPSGYHGGIQSGVWDEKLLEHFIAHELLELQAWNDSDIYVDVAACSSPWAKIIRDRYKISAFAIDLQISPEYSRFAYYLEEDATQTNFKDSSVRGVSLQCAFEMFSGNDDYNLIKELNRILVPGGKAVILPLYMHTHYCSYSSPEYYGKGLSDDGASEYLRMGVYGIPTSRKYNVTIFKQRILSLVQHLGMDYKIYALRNKQSLGENIYCHFILEVVK